MTIQVFLIKPYELERKAYDDDNDIIRILFSLHEPDHSIIDEGSLNMLFLIKNKNSFTEFVSNVSKKEFFYLELKLTELLVDLEPFENGMYALMTGCDESMREGDIEENVDLFASTIIPDSPVLIS